jgi:hypothetical protein
MGGRGSERQQRGVAHWNRAELIDSFLSGLDGRVARPHTRPPHFLANERIKFTMFQMSSSLARLSSGGISSPLPFLVM